MSVTQCIIIPSTSVIANQCRLMYFSCYLNCPLVFPQQLTAQETPLSPADRRGIQLVIQPATCRDLALSLTRAGRDVNASPAAIEGWQRMAASLSLLISH